MQSHERLLCCDIYRAGDGVHAVWLEERLRGASALARLRRRAESVAPLHARDGEEALREPVAARGDLQFENGARRDQGALRPPRRSPAGDLQRRGLAPRSIPACASIASGCAARYKIPAGRDAFSCWSARVTRARAWPRPSRRWRSCRSRRISMVVGREKRIEWLQAPGAARWASRERITFAGPQTGREAVLRRRRCLRAARRSTIRSRTRRSRRWPARCRSSRARKSGAAELVAEYDAGLVCESRDVARSRRTCARCSMPPREIASAPTRGARSNR